MCVAAAGCAKPERPEFLPDRAGIVANQISSRHEQDIAEILGGLFGTPDEPVALPETGLDPRKLAMAAGPARGGTEHGKRHGLYRRHCVQCHGISGDGKGPMAAILNPYPRDFRPGLFKFKSTYPTAQPTGEDIQRTLHDGIPGSAMPSFAQLPADEIAALAEYVKYLSMRGQMEAALQKLVADELKPEEKFDPAENPQLQTLILEGLLGPIVEAWHSAGRQVIRPQEDALPPDDRSAAERAASIQAGRALFFGTQANCAKCHGPTALGDGQQDDYDTWNKANHDFVEATDGLLEELSDLKHKLVTARGKEAELARDELREKQQEYNDRRAVVATLLAPRHVAPRNLREGIYRGGRRPIDMFWRVSAGIPGTPMPGNGPVSEGMPGTLTQQEIWQVIDYVYSLPYEPASLPPRSSDQIGVVSN